MQRTFQLVSFALALLIIAGVAHSRDPKWGGLAAVAVSPDGKTVATGGDNRVLYVLDAETLQVKERIWTETRIGNLAFSRDGSQLLIEDDDDDLHYFDTRSWKAVRKVSDAGYISPAPAADLLAAQEKNGRDESIIRFLSMKDGSIVGSATYPGSVAGFDLSADGKLLAVLSTAVDGDEEKKDAPPELKGLDKKEHQHKHDGKVARLVVYAVPSGQEKAAHDLWLTSSDTNTLLVHDGTDTWIINYKNEWARIAKDGTTTMLEGKNSYNYGVGVSGDRKTVLTGGLRTGTVTHLPDAAMSGFELDRIAGWPEYFEGFAVGSDGTAYAVTSAHRLAKLSPQGALVNTVPVY